MINFCEISLPFGGDHQSGTGFTHGYFGFMEFIHQRAVSKQGFLPSTLKLFYPPYTFLKSKLLRILIKYFHSLLIMMYKSLYILFLLFHELVGFIAEEKSNIGRNLSAEKFKEEEIIGFKYMNDGFSFSRLVNNKIIRFNIENRALIDTIFDGDNILDARIRIEYQITFF